MSHDPSIDLHAPSSGSAVARAMPAHSPDLLSQVLGLVRLRGGLISTAEIGESDGIAFMPGPCHFHFVERGSLCVRAEGEAALHLSAGDLVLLLHGKGHSLTGLKDESSERDEVLNERINSPAGFCEHTGASVVAGVFQFEGAPLPPILSALPNSIHLPRAAGPGPIWLTSISDFLVEETRSREPGSALMISRLIDLLVIRTLRAWVQEQPAIRGWLAGLKEERVGRVLAAIHTDPFRAWSVEDMAAIAVMSRSAFAERFTETVGSPPLRYMTRWKLSLASDLLKVNGLRVSEVARRIGYKSEAAFSRAFKSLYGRSPSEARLGLRTAIDDIPLRAGSEQGHGAGEVAPEAPSKSRSEGRLC